jgi:hypothetical protein
MRYLDAMLANPATERPETMRNATAIWLRVRQYLGDSG